MRLFTFVFMAGFAISVSLRTVFGYEPIQLLVCPMGPVWQAGWMSQAIQIMLLKVLLTDNHCLLRTS